MLNSTADDATRRIRAGSVSARRSAPTATSTRACFQRICTRRMSRRFAARSPNSLVCSVKMESRTSRKPMVDTVYFGGGTPSLLEPASLAQIIDAIRASFPSQFEEVTLEADPETIYSRKSSRVAGSGIQPHQHGRAILRRCRTARRGTDASPRRCFPGNENSARRRIRQSQLRFDCRTPASDRSQLGGFGRTVAAACGPSTCRST